MSLTVPDIAAILARVTYKPEWQFAAHQGQDGPHLTIITDTMDVDTGDPFTFDSSIPPLTDEADLHAWLVWRLARIEMISAVLNSARMSGAGTLFDEMKRRLERYHVDGGAPQVTEEVLWRCFAGVPSAWS